LRQFLSALILAIILVAALAAGAPGAITVEGPDKVKAGEAFRVQIKGAEFNLDPDSTIADIVNEVRKVQVQHENELLGVELRMRIVPDGFQVTLEAEVTAKEEGVTFIFAIDRTDKTKAVLPVAVKVIQVGEVPDPDPPTPDKGPRYLLFLYEKHPKGNAAAMKIAAEWEQLLLRVRAAEGKGEFKSHVLKMADDDADEAAYATYKAKRTNDDPTPTLFIIENDPPHAELWHGPSPKSLSEIKALLAEHGG